MAEGDAESIVKEPQEDYDEAKGKEVASWVWSTVEDDARFKQDKTRENQWEKDWAFINGKQWDGQMASYRRPVKMNAWRRIVHAVAAVLLGGRPTLKVVPQGGIDERDLKTWQDALWAVIKREQFYEQKATEAYLWALVGDGGWWKFGYGRWAEESGEDPDVLISSPHPTQVVPDRLCVDPTLVHCHHISLKDTLDLSVIGSRYPGRSRYVTPDQKASVKWGADVPGWVNKADNITTIGPVGGWTATSSYRRGMVDVVEHWTDDPSTETYMVKDVANLKELVAAWMDKMLPVPMEEKAKLIGLGSRDVPQLGELLPRLQERLGSQAPTIQPQYRETEQLRWKYPKGRVITCSREVVLRDIPNPFHKAFSWNSRWPFVFVPGAWAPHTVWRPGMLADNGDIQYAINKGLSLLLENEIKCTNALVVADDGAMDDDDWNNLQLFPGAKILKAPGSEFQVVFPQPLPEAAYRFPDYMIRKLEEQVGLQDPQMPPGQVVAAKTVALMGQKGSFLLGAMAKMMDEANERAATRIMGLMRDRYLPTKQIPYFEGENMSRGMTRPLPSLPGSVQLRVEASSALQEQQQAQMAYAQAAEQARAARKGK